MGFTVLIHAEIEEEVKTCENRSWWGPVSMSSIPIFLQNLWNLSKSRNVFSSSKGGRNGYGAKLCNIFSTKFTVVTACKEYKKKFKQVRMQKLSLYLRRQIKWRIKIIWCILPSRHYKRHRIFLVQHLNMKQNS